MPWLQHALTALNLNPGLPAKLSHPASLQYDSTVLVIGGKDGYGVPRDWIHQFDESNMKWSVREEKLHTPRSGHIAIPVPGTITKACVLEYRFAQNMMSFLNSMCIN